MKGDWLTGLFHATLSAIDGEVPVMEDAVRRWSLRPTDGTATDTADGLVAFGIA